MKSGEKKEGSRQGVAWPIHAFIFLRIESKGVGEFPAHIRHARLSKFIASEFEFRRDDDNDHDYDSYD